MKKAPNQLLSFSMLLRRPASTRVLMMFVILLFSFTARSQTSKVTGVVKDETGAPLPGVSVHIKGTQTGASTNQNGGFAINVKSFPVALTFAFIGYESREMTIEKAGTVTVELKPSNNSLNQVVVVGYGVQKKVNLTGSVSTIDSKTLENRPVTNVSSALAGLSAGVFVQQGSGRPGADGSTIRIRGTGTLNNNDALVVIDGIPGGDINSVNPNDIETISVLKDAASSSIYGSVAANGVILITTKKGNPNKTTISYTGMAAITEPAAIPSMVSDYVRHMNLVNEGFRNLGQANAYSQATIDAWAAAKLNPNGTNAIGVPNYIAYPNTDWGDEIFNNTVLQNHNLSVSGGSEKIRFLLSGGYLNNKGVMDNTWNKRYQFRGNLEAKVNRALTIGTNTFVSSESSGINGTTTFDLLYGAVPGQYPYLDGKFGYGQAPEETLTNNPLQTLHNNDGYDRTTRFNSTLFANIDITKKLRFEGKVNYQTLIGENSLRNVPNERWDFGDNEIRVPKTSSENLTSTYGMNRNYLLTFDDVLRYNTVINTKHDVAALVGYNQYYFNNYNFSATGLGLIDPTIYTLGSTTSPKAVTGNEYDYAMRSVFGRLNYAYDQRYLFEAVFRYDGSSRFASGNRWGFFPALSAGWRISEENFMKNNEFISNLKLRASYGKTGNNAVGNYAYQSTYGQVNYSYNGLPVTGLAKTGLANSDLEWETTWLSNVGLDIAILKGAVTMDLDLYNKKTEGILFQPDIPLTVGTATAPYRNIASVLNRGVEVALGYQSNPRKQFSWSVMANFAYNYNNVTNYKGQLTEGYTTDASGASVYTSNLGDVSTGGNQRVVEQHKINEYYLYSVYKGDASYRNADGSVNINGGPKDGMIRTTADLDWVKAMLAAGYKFLPGNTVGKAQIYYGDILYADLNGDGSYGNTFDRRFTGASTMPKYTFGFRTNAKWKNIDFSMIWAGNAGMSYYWNERGFNNSIVELGDGIGTLIADNHYYYNDANPNDPANNINGKYPRLKNTLDSQNNLASDFYLYNASYIKLKNVQLGFTLPDKLLKRVGISRTRIFFTGENLLTITKYPGLDPEIGATVNYPTLRQYSLGLNVSF